MEKVKELWSDIRNSLWFIPSVMGCMATVLAFILIEVDINISYKDLPYDWFLYAGNRAGARSVLSTIASSMATIAGVTFSMTLVALTMASSQFGPRLLRNFITDKGNQLVLGTFTSTFIYSLIILLTIKESGNDTFIPKISIAVGFLLSIYSLGVLIYFIHHIASSIEAEQVIKSSFKDLEKAIGRFMTVDKIEEGRPEDIIREIENRGFNKTSIESNGSGYLQVVSYQEMCRWANKEGVIVHLIKQPGDFISIYEPIADLYFSSQWPADAARKITGMLIVGSNRTPEQEIKFSIKQIVEVAVRALSPGINDPHTAISCINWLGAALSIIGKKHFPSILERNEKGEIKVIRKSYSYASIVDTCFDHLRLYARSNILVTLEILCVIRHALVQAAHPDLQNALRNKAALIMEQVRTEKLIKEETDKAVMLFQNIMAVYESRNKTTVNIAG